MLDHKSGQLTYSLYRETKEKLHDDCDRLEIDALCTFSTDEEYTIVDFSAPVHVEIEKRDVAGDVTVVAVAESGK